MTQATLTGFNLRDESLDLLEQTRHDWISRARVVAHNIIVRKGWVTADDLREVWPVPVGLDARVVGAVFRDRMFIKVGTTATERVSSHGRPISVFGLKEGR